MRTSAIGLVLCSLAASEARASPTESFEPRATLIVRLTSRPPVSFGEAERVRGALERALRAGGVNVRTLEELGAVSVAFEECGEANRLGCWSSALAPTVSGMFGPESLVMSVGLHESAPAKLRLSGLLLSVNKGLAIGFAGDEELWSREKIEAEIFAKAVLPIQLELPAELGDRALTAPLAIALSSWFPELTPLAVIGLEGVSRVCRIRIDGRAVEATERIEDVRPGRRMLVIISPDGRRSERALELGAGDVHALEPTPGCRREDEPAVTVHAPLLPEPDAHPTVRVTQVAPTLPLAPSSRAPSRARRVTDRSCPSCGVVAGALLVAGGLAAGVAAAVAVGAECESPFGCGRTEQLAVPLSVGLTSAGLTSFVVVIAERPNETGYPILVGLLLGSFAAGITAVAD